MVVEGLGVAAFGLARQQHGLPQSQWIPASSTPGTTRCLRPAHLKVHFEELLVVVGPEHAGLCGGMGGLCAVYLGF